MMEFWEAHVLLTQPLTALLSDCLAVYNLCSAIAHINDPDAS